MTDPRFLCALLGLALLPLGACNLGPGRDDDDSVTDDDDDSVAADDDDSTGDPTVVTIADIHAGNVADGSFVTIEGVVVTTPMMSDEDDNEGAFWVANPAGGRASGLYVFTFFDVVEALQDADQAEPGDVLNITGTYIEAFDYALPELRLTNASNIEVVGTTPLPTPFTVAAADIAGGFSDSDLWGTIVEVLGTTVDQAPTNENYYEWSADGVIVVDDFVGADVLVGYTIDRLVGVLHPNYGDASVFPRWGDDIGFTYPGCENSWDETSVQGARCRVVDEETSITLDGLVVTSPAPFFGNAFFAQDLDAVGNFAGIQVYAIFDDLVIPALGDVVNVTGEAELFRGQTELVVFNGSDVVNTGANRLGDLVPLPLADPCDVSEEHEGMLVAIASVTVDALDYNFYPFADCPKIGVGSIFYSAVADFEAATGGAGTVSDLVGIVSERDDEMAINPRSASDWGAWGSGTSLQ